MINLTRLRQRLFGAPLDPFNPKTRHHVALMAFLAWVGLGADGLSSACYGPEEAFRALGPHTHMGLYLAVLTGVTVFVIAMAYNQVIELFPSGGGGYKVATQLLGQHAGLVSGAALIVDYVLTIAISVASGMDALFSLLPPGMGKVKLLTAAIVAMSLMILNLRGMKESIRVLLPVFLGFFVSHVLMILWGIDLHADRIAEVVPATFADTGELVREIGWFSALAFFLRAYSLGGGTYTGLEAVSNNVHMLAEPRIRTGKWTMFYMALSLAFMAGGVILLYLLWDATPVDGKTLNAVAFENILAGLGWPELMQSVSLTFLLACEAGLLIVAANTGYLGGPAVLANMAGDSWMPHQFRHLSNRLVTQNGVVLMGLAALAILLGTGGSVGTLVVLYSINVFLTFSLSLAGLCRYWIARRGDARWLPRLALSLVGLIVTAGILIVTVVEKFTEGGWVTILITGVVIGTCLLIRRHYDDTRLQLQRADALYGSEPYGSCAVSPVPDHAAPTAVIMVGSSRGGGMYALKWVLQNFPGHFRNFVFIGARTVDAQSFGGEEGLRELRQSASIDMHFYVNYCQSHGMPAEYKLAFGTDAADEVETLALDVAKRYPQAMFFASKLVFDDDNWFIRSLHSQTALAMQNRLHLRGLQTVILPMRVDDMEPGVAGGSLAAV